MNKTFRIVYSIMLLFLVIFFGLEHFEMSSLDRNEMFFPFLIGLTMLALFFCIFLVKALFNGDFKIYDFLELVGAFLLLLIIQNAKENRLLFISIFAILLIISVFKLVRKPKDELE